MFGASILQKKTAPKGPLKLTPQAAHEFPLIERETSQKKRYMDYLNGLFDFARPLMYELGYPNNNCIGCVKGGMGYWNRIRKDFPDVFESRAKLERAVGHSMLKDKNGPIYLDELDPNRGRFKHRNIPRLWNYVLFSMMS